MLIQWLKKDFTEDLRSSISVSVISNAYAPRWYPILVCLFYGIKALTIKVNKRVWNHELKEINAFVEAEEASTGPVCKVGILIEIWKFLPHMTSLYEKCIPLFWSYYIVSSPFRKFTSWIRNVLFKATRDYRKTAKTISNWSTFIWVWNVSHYSRLNGE